MARKPARQIDYGTLGSSDLVWLAQVDDDKLAIDEIFARVGKVVNRIAGNYCRRYTWIDPEDLSQSLLAEKLPKIIKCYRPGKNTDWEKYVYHRLTFSAKDLLRCEDPLGIGFPQKKQYPEWHRLGDEAFDGFEVTGRKEMDSDELDMLKLHESIGQWRESFDSLRNTAVLKKPVKAIDSELESIQSQVQPLIERMKELQRKRRELVSKNTFVSGDVHASVWVSEKTSGRFIGRFDYRRKFLKRVSLRSWISVRTKPKQLVLF